MKTNKASISIQQNLLIQSLKENSKYPEKEGWGVGNILLFYQGYAQKPTPLVGRGRHLNISHKQKVFLH